MLYTQTFLGFSVLTFTFFVVTLFGTAYKTSVASIWGDTNLTHLHFLPSALPPGIAPHLHLSDTVNTHTHTHTYLHQLPPCFRQNCKHCLQHRPSSYSFLHTITRSSRHFYKKNYKKISRLVGNPGKSLTPTILGLFLLFLPLYLCCKAFCPCPWILSSFYAPHTDT